MLLAIHLTFPVMLVIMSFVRFCIYCMLLIEIVYCIKYLIYIILYNLI